MDANESEFCDLTEDDESSLPLPDGWITLIKIPLPGSTSAPSQMRTYKNVRLSIESNEHPLIVQAQTKARKRGLPDGWQLKSAVTQYGDKEIFYYNASLELSMWDHPLLRSELCDVLNKMGHSAIKLGIAREPKLPSKQHLWESSSNRPTNAPGSVASGRASLSGDYASVRVNNDAMEGDRQQTTQGKSDRSVAISEFDRSLHSANSVGDSPSSSGAAGSDSHSDPFDGSPSLLEAPMGGLYLDNDFERGHGSEFDYGGDQQQTGEGEVEGEERQDGYYDQDNAAFSPASGADALQLESVQSESVVDNQRDWQGVLNAYKDPGSEFDKISHRVKHIKPPVTVSGIRVLREDVMEANERVHHLLMRLRSLLSAKSGIECSILYHQNGATGGSGNSKVAPNNVTLASDIVTALRQKPEYVVLAMANTNNLRDGSAVMVQVAFTALHRLLHPFSADSSMTTAVLLQGINYQLDELTAVEQVFSELDSKVIIARALFVADPDSAVTWDPLLAPLPVVPEAKAETVLTCLLRVYAIRRDVTSYFRTIWRPILPGVVALLKEHGEAGRDEQQHLNAQAHSFANTIAVANRLLECTLSEKSILTFPPIATAVCRAVHEIGGKLALHTYLFQLLILPNLLKVLAGDHESAENEDIYRVDNVDEIVNKYYDSGFWFKKSGGGDGEGGEGAEATEPGILDPLRTLIWLVWRIYTCSVFMSETAVTALSMKEFLSASKPIALDQHAYAYPTMRLRNTLCRLRRKVDRGCAFLLTMPMDAQGSEYLGVSEEDEEVALASQIQKLDTPGELAQLLDRRVHALHFKPNEMLHLTIASRYEVGALFSDVALAMEMHDQAAHNPLYHALAEYLNHNMEDFDAGAAHEELMELSFLYVSDDFSGYGADATHGGGGGVSEEKASFDTNELVVSRYDQLLRGLRLSNRYEDSLIKMVTRLQSGRVSSLFELVEDESWFHAPEFDANAKSDTVRLAKAHTVGSISKKKSAHYGLARAANVPVFPLFSRFNAQDHHPGHTSLKALQGDVFKSYRFHTAASCAGAGTSLARQKVLPPKVHPSSIIVTTGEANGTSVTRNRSRYTKIEINPNSNILAPTKNVTNHKNPIAENPTQKHTKFLKSLRDHGVIPTDEFQARYQKVIQERRRHKRQLMEQQLSAKEASHGDGPPTTFSHSARILKPFPEYLRNRRYGQQQQQSEGFYHDGDGGVRSSYESRSSRGGGSRSTERSRNSSKAQRGRQPAYDNNRRMGLYDQTREYQADEVVESPQSLAQDIIRDFSQLFAAPPAAPARYATAEAAVEERPQFMYVSRDSHHRAVSPASSLGRPRRSRSRSPGLPEPMPAQTRFQSPTRALLHRLTDHSEQDLRRSQELRKYERNTDFEADEPFSPTALKVYPPRGLRVPRVPEFLYNEEISDYTRTASRASSRSMSRSNSFSSSSPVRGRSRDNSFSNLTHVCRRALNNGDDTANIGGNGVGCGYENEYEEYLPISEPSTPVQVPALNTEIVDLSVTRSVERRVAPEVSEQPAQSSAALYSSGEQQPQHFNASLPKHKKVNVALVHPPAPAAAPAGPPAPTSANSAPRVIPLPTGNKWRALNEPTVVPPVPAPVPVRPEPLRPQEAAAPVPLVMNSAAAAPLSPPAMLREQQHQRAPLPAVATEHKRVPASAHVSLARQEEATQLYTARPLPYQAPVPAAVAPPTASATSSSANPGVSVPKKDTEPVGFKYAVTFPPRPQGATSSTAAPSQDDLPSHVYDVNAAYEEAYQRARASMHPGGDSDNHSDGEGTDGDDDVRALGYVSAANRQSMRAALMQKQKSKSRRASKLFVEDDQVVSFLSDGFQAIKHGRSGKSKAKLLRYNPSLRVIEWDDQGTDRLRVIKSFFRRNSAEIAVGSGAEDGPAGASNIALDSIKSVYTGVRTEVMVRAGAQKPQDPACCLSLVTDARSLDLTLVNATERDRVVRGLKILLEDRGVPFL